MSDTELMRFLHIRLFTSRKASQRLSLGLIGRIFNFLAGQNPRYIPVNWTQLKQSCAALGERPADLVSCDLRKGDKFMLRCDYAEKALTALNVDNDQT